MAIDQWCGKSCGECAGCRLDESMPCSPDCENLSGNRINMKQCMEDECSEIGYIFGAKDPEHLCEAEKKRLLDTYGDTPIYPY